MHVYLQLITFYEQIHIKLHISTCALICTRMYTRTDKGTDKLAHYTA